MTGKYWLNSRPFTKILPLPLRMRTRAIAFFRRPVPRQSPFTLSFFVATIVFRCCRFLFDAQFRLHRLLGLMRMVRPGIDLQPLDHFERQLVLRQHAANGVAKNTVRMPCKAALGGLRAKARVAGEPGVFLLG